MSKAPSERQHTLTALSHIRGARSGSPWGHAPAYSFAAGRLLKVGAMTGETAPQMIKRLTATNGREHKRRRSTSLWPSDIARMRRIHTAAVDAFFAMNKKEYEATQGCVLGAACECAGRDYQRKGVVAKRVAEACGNWWGEDNDPSAFDFGIDTQPFDVSLVPLPREEPDPEAIFLKAVRLTREARIDDDSDPMYERVVRLLATVPGERFLGLVERMRVSLKRKRHLVAAELRMRG